MSDAVWFIVETDACGQTIVGDEDRRCVLLDGHHSDCSAEHAAPSTMTADAFLTAPEADVDAELRSMGIDPEALAARGLAVIRQALANLPKCETCGATKCDTGVEEPDSP